MTPLDMTTMLRPFFWLAVGVLALAPVVFVLARDTGSRAISRPRPRLVRDAGRRV